MEIANHPSGAMTTLLPRAALPAIGPPVIATPPTADSPVSARHTLSEDAPRAWDRTPPMAASLFGTNASSYVGARPPRGDTALSPVNWMSE